MPGSTRNKHTMTGDLFAAHDAAAPWPQQLGPGTVLWHGLASVDAPRLLAELAPLLAAAPWRHMQTPGGLPMSVAMSSCGTLGWISDRHGYRYSAVDPHTGQAWPAMPPAWYELAVNAAAASGFPAFKPDACLINCYAEGARMALHQDRDERDLRAPIVSVSLGLPVIFLLGGQARSDKAQRLRLNHGDVLVWGGDDRLRYHGVLPLAAGQHDLLGARRINLTFRQAG